jgi:hypothetical protein
VLDLDLGNIINRLRRGYYWFNGTHGFFSFLINLKDHQT